MSNPPETQAKPTRFSPALIGAGILVIAIGFGLPMLTSGAKLENASAPQNTSTPREPASSTTTKTPEPIQPPSATGLGASLLRLVIGLAVVWGLCVFAAKWFAPKPPTTPGAMEVIASIEVARCVIHLVRAGERRLLIGTDFGGVKAILELPGPAPELPQTQTAETSDDASTPLAPTREEILKRLLQLRTRRDAASPG